MLTFYLPTHYSYLSDMPIPQEQMSQFLANWDSILAGTRLCYCRTNWRGTTNETRIYRIETEANISYNPDSNAFSERVFDIWYKSGFDWFTSDLPALEVKRLAEQINNLIDKFGA